MLPIIVRRSHLKSLVGISPSQVDRLEAANLWPRRVRFSNGVVGWHGPEIEKWAEEQVTKNRKK